MNLSKGKEKRGHRKIAKISRGSDQANKAYFSTIDHVKQSIDSVRGDIGFGTVRMPRAKPDAVSKKGK